MVLTPVWDCDGDASARVGEELAHAVGGDANMLALRLWCTINRMLFTGDTKGSAEMAWFSDSMAKAMRIIL